MKYLIRYGEIALKGRNRGRFESKLQNNIIDYFHKNNAEAKIRKVGARFIVDTEFTKESGRIFAEDFKPDFRKVFGITSYSVVTECAQDLKEIKKTCKQLIANKQFKSFRVTTNRANKDFKTSSEELNRILGSEIVRQTKARVSLKEFDYEINIEIMKECAFIFDNKIECFGGLPVGIEGSVISVIEDEKGLLSTLLVMKRGCKAFILNKNNSDTKLIKDYTFGYDYKEIDEINEKILTQQNIKGIVTSEVLEENTDFQNMDGAGLYSESLSILEDSDLIILRPLIGFTADEIKKKLGDFKNHRFFGSPKKN